MLSLLPDVVPETQSLPVDRRWRGEAADAAGRERPEVRMQDLCRAHARPLYCFLLHLTGGNVLAAEDFTQETLLRAWRHLDDLNADPVSQRSWLFTVGRRVCIDAARARRARPSEVSDIDIGIIADPDDAAEQIVDMLTIRRALAALTEAHRTVLVEAYYRDRSISQIAELLDLPAGTVKSRIYYALRALRAALADAGGPVTARPGGCRAGRSRTDTEGSLSRFSRIR